MQTPTINQTIRCRSYNKSEDAVHTVLDRSAYTQTERPFLEGVAGGQWLLGEKEQASKEAPGEANGKGDGDEAGDEGERNTEGKAKPKTKAQATTKPETKTKPQTENAKETKQMNLESKLKTEDENEDYAIRT